MQSQRPIQIEEFIISIQTLPLADLEKTRAQIASHLKRLSDSNSLMEALMKDEIDSAKTPLVDNDDQFNDVDGNATKIYTDSISENMVVIANQKSRIMAIDSEIRNRDNDDAPKIESSIPHLNKALLRDSAVTTDNDLIDTTSSNSMYM